MSSKVFEEIDELIKTYKVTLSTEEQHLLALVKDDLNNPSKDTFKVFDTYGPKLDAMLSKIRSEVAG